MDWTDGEKTGHVKRFYVPLIFFFNRQPGLVLPLVSLQYHETQIAITFADTTTLGYSGVDVTSDGQEAFNASLWIDYVFLDTEERKRFATQPHEMLITQLQYTGDESVLPSTSARKQYNIRLNFNHPCRFFTWVFADPNRHGRFSGAVYTDGDSHLVEQYKGTVTGYAEALAPLYEAKLQLNGHDRADARKGSYYSRVVPWQCTRTKPRSGVFMFSFAISPGEHQPSGTLNCSRIDAVNLYITLKAASVSTNLLADIDDETETVGGAVDLTAMRVFAENYNVLRIQSGMGGLAYSN